jgi:hypothetical protein
MLVKFCTTCIYGPATMSLFTIPLHYAGKWRSCKILTATEPFPLRVQVKCRMRTLIPRGRYWHWPSVRISGFCGC